ncbi:MAG: F0F1 ATP synthase subunit alpha, partial [Leptotrichiaceae bacterium]|nr:F0F1 ATP synthase subunit alpha [Leptotrichiaceae bacterium]
MRIKPEEVSKIIRAEIENYKSDIDVSNTGTVLESGDGIVRIYGLNDIMSGELLEFENGVLGMALNLEENNIGAVIFGEIQGIKEGSTVKGTGKVAEVPVGENLLGRVVNSLGQAIDGKGEIEATKYYPIERDAYGIIDRKPV